MNYLWFRNYLTTIRYTKITTEQQQAYNLEYSGRQNNRQVSIYFWFDRKI